MKFSILLTSKNEHQARLCLYSHKEYTDKHTSHKYEIIYQLDAIEYLFVFFPLDMFRTYTPIFRSNGCYNFFTYAAYGVLGVVRRRSWGECVLVACCSATRHQHVEVKELKQILNCIKLVNYFIFRNSICHSLEQKANLELDLISLYEGTVLL